MKTGIELIADERQRQIKVEGWTNEHDDSNNSIYPNLIKAALCYLKSGAETQNYFKLTQGASGYKPYEGVPPEWPWLAKWWRPSSDPIRNLEKAGALIAAEIDRLNRKRSGKNKNST